MTKDNAGLLDLLEVLTTAYEQNEDPVAVSDLATRVEKDSAAITDSLQSLESYELVKQSGQAGYVPTITARELLEIDIDEDSFFVLEFQDTHSSE